MNGSARRLNKQSGATVVELALAVVIASLIVLSIGGVMETSLSARAAVEQRSQLLDQATFAMERMARAVSQSRQLLVPMADKTSTAFREHVREETVPASPPESGSTKATAVLALSLPAYSDLDLDGWSDADNDRDGRIDEDPSGDIGNDSEPGVYLVDDNGNGFVDDGIFASRDDDEWFSFSDEDPVNGLDDDGDGSIDEDPPADQNNDNCPGICGVDDDGDGSVDEGNDADDDEDGADNEDWIDSLVFYLDGGTLKERTPVPWDESGGGGINGQDFVTSDLTEIVTLLRFERVPTATDMPLVDITLTLTDANGETITLNRRVRVAGAL